MGLLSVPKHITPRRGAPREGLLYVTAREKRMLKAMTDGKLDMTKYGVPSAYMEGSGSKSNTGTQGSKNTNTKTSNSNAGGTAGKNNFGGINTSTVKTNSLSSSNSFGPAAPKGNNFGGISTNTIKTNSLGSKNSFGPAVGGGLLGNSKLSQSPAAPSSYFGDINANSMATLPNQLTQNALDHAKAKALAQQYSQYQSPPGYVNPQAPQGSVGYNPLNNMTPPIDPAQDQAKILAHIKAVSKGPGTLTGVLPGSSAEAQKQTVFALSNALTEAGTPVSPAQLNQMIKTTAGEAGHEGLWGETAASNTMLNRLSLGLSDPKKYGYLGGGNPDKMLAGYDANGISFAKTLGKHGVPANAGYKNAEPGTDQFGQGLNSFAQAASLASNFNQNAPATIKNATHYYNPDVSNPKWGGPGFTPLGNHVFGNAEDTAGLVASFKGQQPTQPTMVASANPMAAPPSLAGPPQPQATTPQQTPFSWDGIPGADMVKAAYNAVDKNLIQPTKEQVDKYGGFKKAGKLAQMAVAIMNFLPGGNGKINTAEYKSAGGPPKGGSDLGMDNGFRGGGYQNPVTPTAAPVTTQAPAGPVAPAPANWMWPQYTQTWAGLPTGIGGPIWQPLPGTTNAVDPLAGTRRT